MSRDSAGPSEAAAVEAPALRQPRRRRGRPSRARGHPNSSDDATARWTIRGVPPPVRDMALKAATARGMTVGDWVAEAIVTLARSAERLAAAGPRLPTVDPPPDLAQVLRTLDERLSRLEERRRPGFFGRLFGRRS
ncbi:MAG TPA: hypothetical protein VLE23_18755 [Geminicoccaceae bacterium]|nr:hypothetical protein [Geminicoccaceae bacterium]